MTNLNERQKKMIEILIILKRTSAKELSESLQCSTKTVYSDLNLINSYLKKYDIKIVKRPRVGIYVEGEFDQDQILKDLHSNTDLLDSDGGRKEFILLELLNHSKPFSMDDLSTKMFLTNKSVNQYLDEVSQDLREMGVTISRKAHVGIKLIATEDQKRSIIFRLLNRYWKDHWAVGRKEEFKYYGLTNKVILPDKLVQKVIKIISSFLRKNKISLSDYQFQSLAIHTAIAVQRIKAGNLIAKDEVVSKLLNDTVWLGPAQELAHILEQELDVTIPKQEVKYLEMHLMMTNPSTIKSTNIENSSSINDLKKLLINTGYDRQLISNLYVHLVSAIKRLEAGATITNPYKNKIIYKYHQAYDNALLIADFYANKYHIKFNEDEVAYIAMHIEAYYERVRTKDNEVKVALVCSTGLGSAQLLAAKVRSNFPNLKIVGIWSVEKLKKSNLKNVDLILSTIQLQNINKKIFVVSPLLDDRAKKQISDYVSNIGPKHNICELIDHRLIFVNPQVKNYQELIKFIGHHLIRYGYAKKNIIESALKREKISLTSFDYYAMPHGNPKYISSPIISITTFKKPIKWGKNAVSFVIFIALTSNLTQKALDVYFDQIYSLVTDKKTINEICNQEKISNILKIIKEKTKNC